MCVSACTSEAGSACASNLFLVPLSGRTNFFGSREECRVPSVLHTFDGMLARDKVDVKAV